jgi:YVTN family beta-propeller protein
VEFRILGPLEVETASGVIELGGQRQRALLALLLVHRNQAITTDLLVDELWGEHPPATAQKIVQVYVSRLRGQLGAGRIETRGHGYALMLRPGELDLDRFEQLVERSEDEAPRAAAATLRDALSLFRQEPLGDLRFEPWAQPEVARLDEMRLGALEQRLDADLELGRHRSVVAELEALVRQNPLRERFRGQLMLALYRSGRQADALESYRLGRLLLDEQLGLKPGPELRELEQRILRQDPSLAAPAASKVAVARRRRGALLVVAGAALLLAAVFAAVVELSGSGTQLGSVGSEVVAIDPASGGIVAHSRLGTTPSNIVVGNGSVWVLDADDRTITQLDEKTTRPLRTFNTGKAPTDLASGAGALWVGNGATTPTATVGTAYMASVSRMDARSTLVTRTLELSKRSDIHRIAGISQLAVGAGGVWAIDPGPSVSRIDPATGQLVKRIHVSAPFAIAASREGVWVVVHNGTAVVGIDPRSNKVTQKIPVNSSGLAGIAVGAGSIWATDPIDGVVWRIEPGPRPLTRTIPAGFGVTNITFGDGVVWTANFIDGTVSLIDPGTNRVTRKIQLSGTPEGIAAHGGSVWASVSGGTRQGALPRSACAPVEDGGRASDVLIASDLPLRGSAGSTARSMAEAIRFVLRRHGFRAGKFSVGYQSCDDSTAQSGNFDFFKCASNAKAFGQAARLVTVIGPSNSECAQVEIPITNRAGSGALPMISPANTWTGLTRSDLGTGRGEPETYYPAGVRSYTRTVSPDTTQGVADARLAHELGFERVYVLSDGTDYGSLLRGPFARTARGLGLVIAGSATWNPAAKSYAALADRVARSGARGVFLAGYWAPGLVAALRAKLGPKAVLIAGDGFLGVPDLLEATGGAAVGMYISYPGVATDKLGAAGRRFMRDFSATQPRGSVPSGTYVPEAAEAAEVALAAIARSDGTRASVLRELRTLKIEKGILGTFQFDRNGDMTPGPVAIFHVTGGRGGGGLVSDFRGSVADRLIYVSTGVLDSPRVHR